MSRAQLTSTVEQNTGGAVAPFVAGKNKIINGDFSIWQRGIGAFSTAGSNTFTADRWQVGSDGSTTASTSQKTFTPGNAISGYESTYYLETAITAVGGNNAYILQRIEDVRAFANQTITISWYAKCSSGTVSSQGLIVQAFGSYGSGSVVTAFPTASTITTSWQRFTQTFTVPSISGATIGTNSFLEIQVIRTPTSSTIDLWGVQVERGPVATPFTTASGTLQGELALCQRYLPALIGPNQSIVSLATGTTSTFVTIKMPVTARVAPTGITIPSLSLFNVFNGSLSTANPTAISFDSSGTDYVTIAVTTSAGSPTIAAGQADLFRLNSTGAYILFTGCEL